ncbi:MAG: ATP-binding protein [Burkholderiales bacterium]|nr:ATP-binding protein [Burkholderiales bacterium]
MSDNTVVSMDARRGEFKREGRWAPLRNVMLASRAVNRAMNREPSLPGIVVLYGPSGWGKSMAASYCANKHDGFYVVCRSYFTKKSFVETILREMGIRPARTVGDMMEQAATQLDLSGRPLIIDEMDHLVDRNMIEIVRDLHEMSRSTFLLIGEEQFPRKLRARSERFHNRVLVWQPAQPASREDARDLAQFYVPGVEIGEDLLDNVRRRSGNVARVICVNLDAIREHCQKAGLRKINLEAWGDRNLFTGDAPARSTERAERTHA